MNSRGSQSNFIAALGLVGQTKVGVNGKGELVTPFNGLNGKPLQWVETAPFVWRATGASHERLAAKVVDGKAVRFSIDGLSPFMVFDRTPWYQDSAWLLPLLCASLAALALTAITWPDRRHRAPPLRRQACTGRQIAKGLSRQQNCGHSAARRHGPLGG